jgi:hypothetical protein
MIEPSKPISRKSRRPTPLQLVLTVQYYGLKATQYFSNYSKEGVTRLKKDLELLKFPLPKFDNVSFVSHGVMKAVWIDPNHVCMAILDIAYINFCIDNPSEFGGFGT